MEWRDNRYVVVEDATVKKRLQPWLHQALRYICDKRSGNMLLVPFESNPGTVNAALETIRNYTHLSANLTPPIWLEGGPELPDPREILSCKTLNLHIPTGKIIPATPALFTTCALDFDHDANATAPMAWIGFLKQLFGDDMESIELLQDWFGYCLTPDTSQQKMLLIVGPKRSGKGTIGRVLRELIGRDNVVGPTTSGLAGQFGLQPLIGKSLAVVSDARFSGQDILTVIERLLCISGEDVLTIDRKHLGAVTMRLATRFVFLTNELPKLTDTSGALAGRFVILRLTESFYGREDHGLTERLLKELPGILLWALQGWSRLRARGHFIQPKSVDEAIRDLEDLASPVGAFVRDRCVVAPGRMIDAGRLYEAWKAHCAEMGRDHAGTKASFGRDLRAAVPHLRMSNRRVDDGRDRFYEGVDLGP
jgi:putative DNA primase/helicase